MPAGGTAAGDQSAIVYAMLPRLEQRFEEWLGEATRVVAAFQNIGAHHLKDLDYKMECDVLICGQKAVDKDVAMQLAADAGLRGVNAGSLQNAGVVEGLTSLLIFINIKNKVRDAGIRITGI